ncbi:thiamine pyrophosphate-binding protein [Halarcobacter ebronensis]|uniref:thiamine pyrophosphate-binding protein n=1 Tax=Halarcobacter ebronensis TaxID=1462615 RepID=UPI0013E90763|nr:thiamine pyrophosphate-binding protein [Halarcobacter ebronensis]
MAIVKLSDYIIDYLERNNINKAFVIQGGAVAHLIDSIAKHPNFDYFTCQHEQACAIAADGMSRTSKTIGLAIATSGPGATNLITGIANAYYDSIPVLFITGNVASFRQSNNLNVRQYGFQETDIVNIVKPITKYSIRINKPTDIKYEIDKALFIAKNGRKGPVLIDIPDDFQRELIDTSKLKKFTVQKNIQDNKFDIEKVYSLLKNSKRPVLVYGNGILSSNSIRLAVNVSNKLKIPTLYSWPLKGIFSHKDSLNYGSFGTNSSRTGNFIIQNSDLIISIGNRLDTHATGTLKDFARNAKILLVDIDENELNKFEKLGKKVELKLCVDAKYFLNRINNEIKYIFTNNKWLEYCQKLKDKYSYKSKFNTKFVSPIKFFKKLSKEVNEKTIFVGDTGANLVYLLNFLKEKKGQQFISAFNNTPMGYSLAAAIGISISNPKKNIICCIGDGGIQMNIQELATISYYNLPITIIVFNNYGHGMIKQTQDDWFKSTYEASSSEKGIPKINFNAIAKAYNIKSFQIKNNSQINSLLTNFNFNEPILIELLIDESLRIDPMLQFGRPLEDMNPLLQREEFMHNMIIKPLQISEKI